MRDSTWGIYIMNGDGSGEITVAAPGGIVSGPTCAPNAGKIIFSAAGQLHLVEPDGSNLTALGVSGAEPDWSPDGSKVAFSTQRDCNWEIYTMYADGSNQLRLINNAASDRRPSWSADGTQIAFGSSRDGHWEIYVMSADGSNQKRLTSTPFDSRGPSWSP